MKTPFASPLGGSWVFYIRVDGRSDEPWVAWGGLGGRSNFSVH